MYTVPNAGYLYMFLGPILDFQIERTNPCDPDTVLSHIYSRARSSLDGNAAYTKQYKKFETLLGHADILDIIQNDMTIRHLYGLTRLGDKKPRQA